MSIEWELSRGRAPADFPVLSEWFGELRPGPLLHRIVADLLALDGCHLRPPGRTVRDQFEMLGGSRFGNLIDERGERPPFPQVMVKFPLTRGPVDLTGGPFDWSDDVWDDSSGSSLPSSVWTIRALVVSPQGFMGEADSRAAELWDATELARLVLKRREELDGWLLDLVQNVAESSKRARPGSPRPISEPDMHRVDRSVLGPWLIEALGRLGGAGTMAEVSREIWIVHEQELRAMGRLFYTWQYDLRWVAQSYKRVRVERVGESYIWRLAAPDVHRVVDAGTLF